MGLDKKKLSADEQVVLHLRTHWKALVGPILVLLLDAIILGLGIALVHWKVEQSAVRLVLDVIMAVLFLIVLIAFVVMPWLRWLTTTYTFTNRRIITQRGILNRSGHDLPLTRINDVTYDKSLLDRMFGCGTLKLTTAAEDPVILDDIPDVERVHVTMNDMLYADQQAPQQYGTPYPEQHTGGNDY